MTQRVRLGNPGSRLYDVKLVCLHVLARAEGVELRVSEILERGWPTLFPPEDREIIWPGSPGEEARIERRRLVYRVERDAAVALRDLRAKGLAKSRRPDGWTALLWLITPDGEAWRRDDAQAFHDSVLSDLAALPTGGHDA